MIVTLRVFLNLYFNSCKKENTIWNVQVTVSKYNVLIKMTNGLDPGSTYCSWTDCNIGQSFFAKMNCIAFVHCGFLTLSDHVLVNIFYMVAKYIFGQINVYGPE